MESRYFAGPAAIILVDGEISGREKDAYKACSFHYCQCNNAHRPHRFLEVYNSRESRIFSHVISSGVYWPPQVQDSGLNLPRFCVMA